MKALAAAALPCALLVTACGGDDLDFTPAGVSAGLNTSVATVLDVHWTTSEPSIGYVSYGTTPSLGQKTALETAAATSHTLALLGLAANTVYYYRVITWDGHDAGQSPIQSARSGAPPDTVPTFTVTGDATSDDGFNELTLLPVTGDNTVVCVVGSSGEVLWYHADESARTVTRAQLSSDRTSILYNAIGTDPSDSAIVRVALDGSSVDSIPLPGLGQDFLQLADGTIAALVTDERDFKGKPLRGDQLVEVGANGSQKTVWSSWDCFNPADSPGDGPAGEWTGANALGFDEGDLVIDAADDTYFVGLRNLSTVVKIGRASQTCDFAVGAATPTLAPSLAFASGTPAFKHPGGFFASLSKLAVVDADGEGSTTSRVLEYALDVDAGTATKKWSYDPDPALHIDSLGNLLELTHNRRFVSWSTAGRLEVIGNGDGAAGDGDVRWSLDAGPGVTLGYQQRTTSLYRESEAN